MWLLEGKALWVPLTAVAEEGAVPCSLALCPLCWVLTGAAAPERGGQVSLTPSEARKPPEKLKVGWVEMTVRKGTGCSEEAGAAEAAGRRRRRRVRSGARDRGALPRFPTLGAVSGSPHAPGLCR